MIRFLWYERGQRAVGQALLDAAENYLRNHNVRQITAFPQDYCYSFYHLRAAYLSDYLDPVQAILGFNGYECVSGEVFLDWPNYAPTVTPLSDVRVDISLQWQQGRGARPGLIVQGHGKKRSALVRAFPPVNIRGPRKHRIGCSQRGSIFLRRCKGRVWDVFCFNVLWKRCMASVTAMLPLARVSGISGHSCFTATAAITSWIGPTVSDVNSNRFNGR